MSTTDPNVTLQLAEAARDEIAEQAREAYRHYRKLDDQVNAKNDEIRELRRQIQEQQS